MAEVTWHFWRMDSPFMRLISWMALLHSMSAIFIFRNIQLKWCLLTPTLRILNTFFSRDFWNWMPAICLTAQMIHNHSMKYQQVTALHFSWKSIREYLNPVWAVFSGTKFMTFLHPYSAGAQSGTVMMSSVMQVISLKFSTLKCHW